MAQKPLQPVILMAASRSRSRLPSLILLLLLLLGIPGVEGQEVQQPQGPILVLPGKDVELNCQVLFSFIYAAEHVMWFMGKGPTRKLIYTHTSPSPRVTRINPDSNTDFTISIHNVVPEDTGTYYCAMQSTSRDGFDLRSGRGTEVVVRSVPKVHIEAKPASPVHLDDLVTITCKVSRFYPNDISLVWLENDRKTEPGKAEPATQNADQTFTITSALEVVATKQRNLSVFTCQLVQDSQPLVNVDLMLRVGLQPAGQDGHFCSSESGYWTSSNLGLGIGLFLGKIAVALFLLYLFLQKDHSQIHLAA